MKECVEVKTDAQGYYTALVPPGFVELRLHKRAGRLSSMSNGGEGKVEVAAGEAKARCFANVEEFELEPIDLCADRKGVGPADRPKWQATGRMDWMVFGFPRVVDATGKVQPTEMTMNSFSGVNTDDEGRFSGNVPKTYPPVRWRASWREPNQIQVRDVNYEPKVVSQDPPVLQIE